MGREGLKIFLKWGNQRRVDYLKRGRDKYLLRTMKNDLIVHTRNIVTFGSYNLRCLVPHTWNTLPENIKETTSFEKFESINNWYRSSCKCSLCVYQN